MLVRYAIKKLDLTDVARRTLGIAPTGLLPFGLTLLAFYLPVLAVVAGVWVWLATAENPRLVTTIAQGAIFGFEAIVTPVAAAALTAGTFRKLAMDRPPLGLSLKTGLRDGLRALPVGLVAGLCVALAYGACIIPGFLLATALFVIGPVLAVERPGLVGAFKRSAELTKGSRWGLFAVILAIGMFQGILGRLVWGAYPNEETRGEDLIFDLRAHLVLLFLASVLVSIARGVASGIAYWDLRGIQENLENDQLVALVGGRADPTEHESVDEMIARAKRKRATSMGILFTVIGLIVLGIGGYFARDAIARAREEKRIHDQVEREISQYRSPPPAAPIPDTPAAEEAEPETDTAVLAKRIATATNKRQAIADAMKQEATNLYGSGFGGIFSSVARVPEAKLELAVLPGLSSVYAEMACSAVLSEAMQKSSSAHLTGHCKAGQIAYSRAPLWATALAMALEYRAREQKTEKSALHLAVRKALLEEK